ncbi:hypothetical protein PAXRUDRAFT_86537, partial [Paxillus rubicundulus Ve08.2h10]
DLPSCWCQGRDKAAITIKLSKVDPTAYDFALLFTPTSGIDMLSVFGNGKYPGINEEDDDDPNTPDDASSIPSASVPSTMDVNADEEGELAPLTFEEAFDKVFDNLEGDSVDEGTDNVVEGSINTEPSQTCPPKGPGICGANYVWCEKKWIHKQSVCRLIISPDFTPKAQTCLLCIRGFTPVNKKFGDMD